MASSLVGCPAAIAETATTGPSASSPGGLRCMGADGADAWASSRGGPPLCDDTDLGGSADAEGWVPNLCDAACVPARPQRLAVRAARYAFEWTAALDAFEPANMPPCSPSLACTIAMALLRARCARMVKPASRHCGPRLF